MWLWDSHLVAVGTTDSLYNIFLGAALRASDLHTDLNSCAPPDLSMLKAEGHITIWRWCCMVALVQNRQTRRQWVWPGTSRRTADYLICLAAAAPSLTTSARANGNAARREWMLTPDFKSSPSMARAA